MIFLYYLHLCWYSIHWLLPQLSTVHAFFSRSNSVAIFTTYRICFCSVSQNYTVWCEHTFPSISMISMILITIKRYFNVLWWKKQPFEKKRKYSNSNNKKLSKALKIDFVLSDDEIQFLHSLANSNVGCYCSKSHY